jgi:hypothetical protein
VLAFLFSTRVEGSGADGLLLLVDDLDEWDCSGDDWWLEEKEPELDVSTQSD